jgi:septal ring factor EnvC (AmiA/AmiB activator)
MNDTIVSLIIAAISALLGGGGVAAWLRAKGQNTVDMLETYAKRITTLETRSDEQDKRNDRLAIENAEMHGKVSALTALNEQLDDRLAVQRRLLDETREKTSIIPGLQEENAQLRHRLMVEIGKVEILEREAREFKEATRRQMEETKRLNNIIERQQEQIISLQSRLRQYEEANGG